MGGRRKKPGHVDVAKLDLGTKRVCPNCGTKYYDLNKDPIICPKCGTRFEAPARTKAAPAVVVVEEAPKPVEEAPPGDVEFVSLEEADAESGGAADEEEEEVEIAGQGEDPFLEVEDEGGDDVTSIIGDVDDEEEP
jgi:uncharacterized protein (TIGR02300 family)